MTLQEPAEYRVVTNGLPILVIFFGLFVLCWPIVFSFDLWILKDRGCFLNLDYLLDKNLRLGVDTYYSYGLLPVLIQRVLFIIFGRGYEPLLVCTLVYVVLMAVFWTRLLRHMPPERIWLGAIVAISPFLIWVNPNFPYTLVQLSIVFALLCVLERKLDIALAVSVIGCLSVPSLPLVLAGLLVGVIVVDWWLESDRSYRYLVRQLAPGVATYILIASLLVLVFGSQSVSATALPFQGAQFYKIMHFGLFSSFLLPRSVTFRYYLANPVFWWVTSTLFLFALAALGIQTMFRRRALDPANTFIMLCATVHAVFAFFAYGSPHQHILYDPVLAAGTLFGISQLPRSGVQKSLVGIFIVLGISGYVGQARNTWLAWRYTQPTTFAPHLYAKPDWSDEWLKIVQLSGDHKVLVLSYGTGAHHYFPSVENADVWTLQFGQLFEADEQRLLSKIQAAEVVVEDVSLGPLEVLYYDKNVQREFQSLCLTESTENYQIWWRRLANQNRLDCKTSLLSVDNSIRSD
jgi:hypothetical protein